MRSLPPAVRICETAGIAGSMQGAMAQAHGTSMQEHSPCAKLVLVQCRTTSNLEWQQRQHVRAVRGDAVTQGLMMVSVGGCRCASEKEGGGASA